MFSAVLALNHSVYISFFPLSRIRYTLSALKVIRTSFHPTKLNYTEDHLFLVIFFVQCIRFLASLICFIVWFHVFICVLHCVLFLSFYAFAIHDFMYLYCIICTFVT